MINRYLNNMLKFYRFFLTFFLLMSYGQAVNALTINLKINDTFAKANIFESAGNELLLWFPSEYGNQGEYRNIAKKISQFGVEVWIIDMFAMNYLSPSPNSIRQISEFQISEVINQVIRYSSKRVWLFSSERGAQLALRGLYEWQKKNPENNDVLGGAVLLNPNLFYGFPPTGLNPDFLPITSVINKPVAILQSRLSKKYYYIDELVSQLKTGGAKVKMQTIPKVRERFHFRRYSEDIEDLTRKKHLHSLILRGIRDITPLAKNIKPNLNLPRVKALPNIGIPLDLVPLANPKKLDDFVLRDSKHKFWDTSKLRGNVLLLSFWPEWCNSCRYQLKKLQEFKNLTKSNDFQLLSIYFDGTRGGIKKLIKRYKTTFPILRGNIELIKQLNLREFPSTLIIDKKGKIRYAMYGSVRSWNADNFKKIISNLQREK